MSFFKNLGDELGTGLGKGINSFFSWICRWEKVEGEHQLRTNSFRIAVISFILSVTFVPGLVTCSFKPKETLGAYISSNNEKKYITITVQLGNNEGYIFPSADRFIPKGDHETILYYFYEDRPIDIPYFYYQKRNDAKIPLLYVKNNLCSLVPYGKEILLKTEMVPTYVANMKNTVLYVKKKETLTWFEKIEMFTRGQDIFLKEVTWTTLINTWSNVDAKKYSILAQALDVHELVEKKAGGGLVCF